MNNPKAPIPTWAQVFKQFEAIENALATNAQLLDDLVAQNEVTDRKWRDLLTLLTGGAS